MTKYKVKQIADGAFPSGDFVMITYYLNIPDSIIEPELGNFVPSACVACTIIDKASIDRGCKVYFDISQNAVIQYIPQGYPPHVMVTLVGTLAGDRA